MLVTRNAKKKTTAEERSIKKLFFFRVIYVWSYLHKKLSCQDPFSSMTGYYNRNVTLVIELDIHKGT